VGWDGPVNLFGEPVPERRSARGRPQKCWTVENSRFLLIAAMLGHSLADAASVIGMSLPTVRKHYFSEVEYWDRAKLRMRIKAMGHLIEEMEKGNVAATKQLMKELERADMPGGAARASAAPRKSKPAKLGKKEQALADARAMGDAEGSPWAYLNEEIH
jgi:hypothetical protein